MAVNDWSTTAGSNTAIDGIGIGENCPPGNVNDALRAIMASVKTWYDSIGGGGGSYQPLDATLTALAALVFSADKFLYATGNDAFATSTITAFGRSLLASTTAADAIATLGAASAPIVSGSGGTSCSIALGGGLVMTTRDISVSTGTSSHAYGNSYTYSSWARAWMSGDDSNNDVSTALVSAGLTSASIYSHASGSVSCCLFSIGV